MRRARSTALTTAFLAAAAPAFAADGSDDKEARLACVNAYTKAQKLRRSAALKEAREQLLVCSRPACPQVVQEDCGKWLREVEAAIPSIVITAVDPEGHDIPEAAVYLAGEQILDGLTGRALRLDPGKVTLEARAAGYAPKRVDVVLGEGQQLRQVRITLQPLEAPPSPAPSDPRAEPEDGAVVNLEWPTWVLAGVGLVGMGGFAGFGISARDGDRSLDDCAGPPPACSQSRVDGIKEQYLLANVSLGVGIAGLVGAAAWALFVPPASGAKNEKTLARAPRIDVAVGPSGPWLNVSGSF